MPPRGNKIAFTGQFDDQVSSKLDRLRDNFDRLGKSQAFKSVLQGVGIGVGLDAYSALRAGIGAVTDTIGGSIDEFAAFERQMLNVQTIAKFTGDGLKDATGAVLDLSVQFGQSAETMARGLYDISSSGFAGEQGLEVLEAATRAATAGISTTEEAASGLTAVLNSYGLQAKDAGRVSDVLFKIVERGVITFPELSAEIGKTTALASPLGVSLEEVGAALAVLTKNGIDAENATTQVNAVLTSILQPSKEARDLAEELGLQWDIASLRARGLSGVMADLIAKTEGDQEAMATLLGDARAIRGAFVLASRDGAQLTEELEQMAQASGATADAFAIQSESLAFQQDQVKAALERRRIELGEKLVPLEERWLALQIALTDAAVGLAGAVGDLAHDVTHLTSTEDPEKWSAGIAGQFGKLNVAGGAAARVIRDIGREAEDTGEAAEGLGSGMLFAATTSKRLKEEADRLKSELKKTEDAIKNLTDAIVDELYGDTIRAGEEADLEGRIADLRKELKGTKDERAATVLKGQIAELRGELFLLHLEEAAAEGPQAAIDFLKKEAARAGVAKDEINKLIGKYMRLKELQGELGPIIIPIAHRGGQQEFDERRQHGGPTRPGKTYLVGEHGPELLVEDRHRWVVPMGEDRGRSVVQMPGYDGDSHTHPIYLDGQLVGQALAARSAWDLQIAPFSLRPA